MRIKGKVDWIAGQAAAWGKSANKHGTLWTTKFFSLLFWVQKQSGCFFISDLRVLWKNTFCGSSRHMQGREFWDGQSSQVDKLQSQLKHINLCGKTHDYLQYPARIVGSGTISIKICITRLLSCWGWAYLKQIVGAPLSLHQTNIKTIILLSLNWLYFIRFLFLTSVSGFSLHILHKPNPRQKGDVGTKDPFEWISFWMKAEW